MDTSASHGVALRLAPSAIPEPPDNASITPCHPLLVSIPAG
jgi:hypothetical protein